MTISEILLPEFDMEMAKIRVALERVPMDKLSWRPHEKSMSMARLAGHLAEMPAWGELIVNRDSFDISPIDGPPYMLPTFGSTQELLELLDKNAASARAAIAGASDENLVQPWSLLSAGKTILTVPRHTVLRIIVMNHLIHHRAQLGVYFRLNNIPVPATYGPSADEGTMFVSSEKTAS